MIKAIVQGVIVSVAVGLILGGVNVGAQALKERAQEKKKEKERKDSLSKLRQTVAPKPSHPTHLYLVRPEIMPQA